MSYEIYKSVYGKYAYAKGYIPGKAIIRTGLERGSPEMDSETTIQVLRDAAGAKLSQCAQA